MSGRPFLSSDTKRTKRVSFYLNDFEYEIYKQVSKAFSQNLHPYPHFKSINVKEYLRMSLISAFHEIEKIKKNNH